MARPAAGNQADRDNSPTAAAGLSCSSGFESWSGGQHSVELKYLPIRLFESLRASCRLPERARRIQTEIYTDRFMGIPESYSA